MATARLNLRNSSWDLIWSYVHRILMVNAGVVLANLPLLAALAVVERPWDYPVFFALLSLTVGPSVAGIFAYLEQEDDRAGFRELVRGYRRSFRRAMVLWSLSVATIAVVAADIVVLHDSSVGALLVPALAMVALVVLCSAATALAGLVHRLDVRLRDLVVSALYLSVRRWWITLANAALLVVAVAIVNQAPVLGLATVPGCVLFVVWNNSRAVFPTP